MADNSVIKQELTVRDRKELFLDGVISVEGFGENYLTVDTANGSVSVEGEGLKIESLTKEDGKITVTGKISGVFYSDRTAKQGMLKRLLG